MGMIVVLEPAESEISPFAVPAGMRDGDVVVESFGSPDGLMEWARATFAPSGQSAVGGSPLIVINSGAVDEATIALLRDLRRLAPQAGLVVVSETCDRLMSQRAFAAGAHDVLSHGTGQQGWAERLGRLLAPCRCTGLDVRAGEALGPDLDGAADVPTEAAFAAEVKQRLARAGDATMALHVVNIDSFDIANNAFAPAGGRKLLAVCASRLRRLFGREHVVGRFGTKGFAVLQCGVGTTQDIEALARRMEAQLCQPLEMEGHCVSLSVSIGIARFPQDGRDYDVLAHRAGLAVDSGERADAFAVSFYDESMLVGARSKALLNIELRNALITQRFFLEFQPQIDLRDGRLTGAEALVRWQHPGGNVVQPDHFLPYAEECGLITAIDEWVLAAACRTARHWQSAGLDLRVGVNVSARQFARLHFPDLIARALQEAGLAPACLDIELTEGAMLEDIDRVRYDLARLRVLGISVSIDDFGVGHSSLRLLRQLRVDRLKIDRQFVRNLSTSAGDRVILRTLVGLGHELGFRVVAEGVETAEQLTILTDEGCDEVQGFLFARPMSIRDFLAYARNDPPRP